MTTKQELINELKEIVEIHKEELLKFEAEQKAIELTKQLTEV